MTYAELKKKQQEELNAFPIGFAFNNEQFEKMMNGWGLTVADTDKIYSIGAGGYIRKEDSKKLDELLARLEKERKDFRKNRKELYKGFIDELWNHEYILCPDDEVVLDKFGYTVQDLAEDSDLRAVYKRAVADYKKEAIKYL